MKHLCPRIIIVLAAAALLAGCAQATPTGSMAVEGISFQSGPFTLVGDLQMPGSGGPYPLVVMVHGDGSVSRYDTGKYIPIMERFLRAGYAVFSWDKPGTGESTGEIDRGRLLEQRAQIVLDGIAAVKEHPGIDPERIGLWGISQAGYVMPRVLQQTEDIAFMIAVSCPGEPGYRQGVYLVTAQAVCAGLPPEDVEEVANLLDAAATARTYEEYVRFKTPLAGYPALQAIAYLGFGTEVATEEHWHADDLEGDYFWDPMVVVEQTTIPILAFFGEKDTQVDPLQGVAAYQAALEQAGNPDSQVVFIAGADHNIVLSETGCLEERENRRHAAWLNYPPEYLQTIEDWLTELSP